MVSNTYEGNRLFKDVSKWCTTISKEHFDDYTKKSKLYIINLDDKLYQIQYPFNKYLELKNAFDNEVSATIRCSMLEHLDLLAAISNTPKEDTYAVWKKVLDITDDNIKKYQTLKPLLSDMNKLAPYINKAIINGDINKEENSVGVYIDSDDGEFINIAISDILTNIHILTTKAKDKLFKIIFSGSLDNTRYLYKVYSYKEWAKHYLYYTKNVSKNIPIVHYYATRFSIPYSYLIVSGKLSMDDIPIDMFKYYLKPSSDALAFDMFLQQASDKIKSSNYSIKDKIISSSASVDSIARYMIDYKLTDDAQLMQAMDDLLIKTKGAGSASIYYAARYYGFDDMKRYVQMRPRFIQALKVYYKNDNIMRMLTIHGDASTIKDMLELNNDEFKADFNKYLNDPTTDKKGLIRQYPFLSAYIDGTDNDNDTVNGKSQDGLLEIVMHMIKINQLGKPYVRFKKGIGYETRYPITIPDVGFNDLNHVLLLVILSEDNELTITTVDKINALDITQHVNSDGETSYAMTISIRNSHETGVGDYYGMMRVYHRFIDEHLIDKV